MTTILRKGFTLIELMIVVAIIAILSAIAVPAYQNYTNRTQTSEAFTLIANAKTAVTDVAQNNSSGVVAASSNTAVGLNNTMSGKYVSAISVGANGVITAVMGNQANPAISGDIIIMSPSVAANGAPIVWTCSSPNLPAGAKPISCN